MATLVLGSKPLSIIASPLSGGITPPLDAVLIQEIFRRRTLVEAFAALHGIIQRNAGETAEAKPSSRQRVEGAAAGQCGALPAIDDVVDKRRLLLNV